MRKKTLPKTQYLSAVKQPFKILSIISKAKISEILVSRLKTSLFVLDIVFRDLYNIFLKKSNFQLKMPSDTLEDLLKTHSFALRREVLLICLCIF